MTLLPLLACACPTFEEIAVTSRSTSAAELDPEEALAIVEETLASFAEWTAREGLCVDEIRVLDERTVASTEGPVAADGVYMPFWHRIELVADAGMERVEVHELCHALDHDEGLALDAEGLLDADAVEEHGVYDTDGLRLHEAFAVACEAGPTGLGLAAVAAETCGDDVGADRARFFRDEVFPGHVYSGEAAPGIATASLSWRTGFGYFSSAGLTALDAGGDDDGFVLLVRQGGGFPALEHVRFDVETGRSAGSTDLAVDGIDPETADALLVPTDTGRAWALVRDGHERLVDPDAGLVLVLPDDVLSSAGAVSEGVFYAATQTEAAPLAAFHLATGARLDVPTEGLDALERDPVDAVFPFPGGVGVLIGGTLARLSEGRWITAPPLDGLDGPVLVNGGELVLRAAVGSGRWQPVRLDADWTTWTVDPVCGAALDWGTSLVGAGGRAFAAWLKGPYVELRVTELGLDGGE